MNKRVTRLIAPLLLLAFQQPSPAQEASSQELVVIDLRPKEEKDGIGLLELTGKCNKDVFRIADVATDPVKVELAVAEMIPKKDWTDLSQRTIWHGRRICHAKKPACGVCPLAQDCPAYGLGPVDPEEAAKLVKTGAQVAVSR